MAETTADDITGAGAVPPDHSPGEINTQRRYFLIGATAAVGAVGVVGAAIPFVSSWAPSAKAKAAGAPIRIDISKIEMNSIIGPIPSWRSKPIFVLRRDPEAIDRLKSQTEDLADPDSTRPMQPEYAVNPWRSRKEEYGVYVGLCTHLGCSPKYYGKVQPESFAADWQGGFFCPCHGSRFDLAGRVVKAVPAPTNLEVPPHSYVSDTEIVIGVDGENA
ncbi:MAG: ubiquinol-cytochrome c reductase iron-sulfur subunit [Pseudomonadota bacterium]